MNDVFSPARDQARSRTDERVAVVQMTAGRDPDANLRTAERAIRAAADQGASLVVLPESFAFMGEQDRDVLAFGEGDGDGPLQSFLAAAAARYGVWLVGGTLPLRDAGGGRVRAACLVFDGRGERVGRYDKMHLFDVAVPGGDTYRESATFAPGEDTLVVDSPCGRLGVAVCYDLRFPELFRRMLDQGLELLAVPAAFTAATGPAHWETLLRARAIENLVYVAAANQGGRHPGGRTTHGHSMIVDPWGLVLAQVPAGTPEGLVCHPIDRDSQAALRRRFPVIAHRRLKCR